MTFLWTGIDYLGESHGWSSRGNASGLLDLAGFEKPLFYFRKSLWTDAPMVYLRPTANGVVCYTNCESVELVQDGQSLGERGAFRRSDYLRRLNKDGGKDRGVPQGRGR